MILQKNIAGIWIVRPSGMMPIYTDTSDVAEAIRIGVEAKQGNAVITEEGMYAGTKVPVRKIEVPEGMQLDSVQDIGNVVLCDICNDDFTESDESGGIILHGTAYCPKCLAKYRHDFSDNDWEEAICAAAGVPFRELVLAARGGDNTIKIFTSKA